MTTHKGFDCTGTYKQNCKSGEIAMLTCAERFFDGIEIGGIWWQEEQQATWECMLLVQLLYGYYKDANTHLHRSQGQGVLRYDVCGNCQLLVHFAREEMDSFEGANRD
jgi:hypothetical protein